MNTFRFALRISLFACMILAAGLVQRAAQAGPMYIFVVADPATTAGAGVAAQNGMMVSSSKAGPGTFQLYAADFVTGSFGIKSYNVKLNGTITTFLNRSPNGSWNDTDAAGPYGQGFNDVRTAVAATGITSSGQNPTNPFFVKNIGITAGNFVSADQAGAPNWDSASTTASVSGQWGNYSPTLGAPTCCNFSSPFRYAVLLAEGNYTGAAPTVDLVTTGSTATAVNYFTSATGGAAASAPQLSGMNPFVFPEPATITLCNLALVGGLGLHRRRS
jgi:hypothetical protein